MDRNIQRAVNRRRLCLIINKQEKQKYRKLIGWQKQEVFYLLLGPPVKEVLTPVDLLLQLKKAVQEGLGCGGAARDIDVDGDNPIAATHNRVRVVIVSPSICTASHRYHPPWLRHLIIHPATPQSLFFLTSHHIYSISISTTKYATACAFKNTPPHC